MSGTSEVFFSSYSAPEGGAQNRQNGNQWRGNKWCYQFHSYLSTTRRLYSKNKTREPQSKRAFCYLIFPIPFIHGFSCVNFLSDVHQRNSWQLPRRRRQNYANSITIKRTSSFLQFNHCNGSTNKRYRP